MRPLTARERRLLALGLLVAVFAAVWFAVIAPLLGGAVARTEERARLVATFQRNQRLLDGVPVWRGQAETLKTSRAGFQYLAPSTVAAREQLKQRLARTLSEAGAEVQAVGDLQAALSPGWVGARADAKLSLTQLSDILRRLQSEEPYAVVEYLSVSADRAFAAGHAAPLDVRVEVSAFTGQAPLASGAAAAGGLVAGAVAP